MEPRDEEIGSWLEREVAGCQFEDVRHGKRDLAFINPSVRKEAIGYLRRWALH
jgi:hypothetical protein